ncbi:hypothetical protein [Lysobacter sp. CA199]|uniref:hypothetical protein n=1 Tax=Lysobacter sp. CA199 TaxID=3455608 RepID=UPI003F8D372C
MKLIEFEGHNMVIAKDQPEYMPMPALVVKNRETEVVCCWRLSWRERITLLFTGRIWHSVMTFGRSLQPQLLSVDIPSAVLAAQYEKDHRHE